MTMKMASKKTTSKNQKIKTNPDVKWFVLRGFKIDDKNTTGLLALDKTHRYMSSYEIVDDVKNALKFPSMNVNGVKGFGTPKQWLEFFKCEDDLKEWKFHLLKVDELKIDKT